MSIMSISSIDAIEADSGRQRYAQYVDLSPAPTAAPIDLMGSSRANAVSDVKDTVRRIDQSLGKSRQAVMQEIKSLKASEMSMSSLSMLQMRTTLYKVNIDVLINVSSSVKQSLNTVLNAQ